MVDAQETLGKGLGSPDVHRNVSVRGKGEGHRWAATTAALEKLQRVKQRWTRRVLGSEMEWITTD